MRRRRSMWFWLLVIAVLILLLGLIFGGYRKGTPVGGLAPTTVATYGYSSTVD